VNLKDILDVNNINMSLFAQYKMNFLNIPEKNIRRFEQSWSRRKKDETLCPFDRVVLYASLVGAAGPAAQPHSHLRHVGYGRP
jgi:hypothetical protein